MKDGTAPSSYITASGKREEIVVHYYTAGLEIWDEMRVLNTIEHYEQWAIMRYAEGGCQLFVEGTLLCPCDSTEEAEDRIRQLLNGTSPYSSFKYCHPPRKW